MRRRNPAAAAATGKTGRWTGRQGRGVRGGGYRRGGTVAEEVTSTPRNLVAVRLGGLVGRGAVSVLVGDGEPGGPVFLSRRRSIEFVEIDGRVGRNVGTRVCILALLGAIDRGDRHERNHVIVVSSLEYNLHVGPLSSGVGLPLDYAVSSLLIRITRAWDNRVGVGTDQQSRQSNGSEE